MGRPSDNRDELVEELRARTRSLERSLDEGEESRKSADAIIAQLTQANTTLSERLRELEVPSEQQAPSASPSVLRGSIVEGGKEAVRLLVGGIAALVVGVPSALASLISYFNDAPSLTILTAVLAFFGILGGLVGIYFGIKASADARESTYRVIEEANAAAERALQELREEPRDNG